MDAGLLTTHHGQGQRVISIQYLPISTYTHMYSSYSKQ